MDDEPGEDEVGELERAEDILYMSVVPRIIPHGRVVRHVKCDGSGSGQGDKLLFE